MHVSFSDDSILSIIVNVRVKVIFVGKMVWQLVQGLQCLSSKVSENTIENESMNGWKILIYLKKRNTGDMEKCEPLFINSYAIDLEKQDIPHP